MNADVLDAAELSLWLRWREAGDRSARDALILKYAPWSRTVARTIYVRVYLLRDAWDDCAQNALIGLMESVDRFQPDRGVSFILYARHRVRGAVFNGLRAIKEELGQLRALKRSEQDLHDRINSLDDSAADLSDPLEGFVSMTVGLGLGFLMDTNSIPFAETGGDAYSDLESRQLSSMIADALETLPERENLVLLMHYFHHVPFVHIASDFGVTKGRISQLHKQGLERLRDRLGNIFDERF